MSTWPKYGVPQIMESRLIPGAIFATDASPDAEALEAALHEVEGYAGAKPGNKEGCITALRVPCLFSLLRILRHCVIQLTSQWHQPGLVELRVPDGEHRLLQVRIPQIQGNSFAIP